MKTCTFQKVNKNEDFKPLQDEYNFFLTDIVIQYTIIKWVLFLNLGK